MTVRRWHAGSAAGAWTVLAMALHELGDDRLALPSSWATAGSWYETVGASTATVALLRMVAMALSTWLAAATVLQLAASVRPGRCLRRAADRISPRWMSELWKGMASASLSASLAAAAMAPALPPAQPAPTPTTTTTLQGDGQIDDVAPAPPPDRSGIAVMRSLPEADPGIDAQPTAAPPTTTTTSVLSDASPPREETAPAAAVTQADGDQIYVIEPGDSCWSIAEEMLAEAKGATPDDRQTAELWQRLIELNSDRFPTGDPDLLYAGQRLLLPSIR